MSDRVIKLTPKLRKILDRQEELFREKFGRAPGPNDPVFFDPEFDTPTPMSEQRLTDEITKAAIKAGISPERAMRHIFPNG